LPGKARCSCFVLLKAWIETVTKSQTSNSKIMSNYSYSKGQTRTNSNLFQFLFDFVNHSFSIASMPLEKPVQSYSHLTSSPYLKKINRIQSGKQQQLITIQIA
jgi:hypothetical protein